MEIAPNKKIITQAPKSKAGDVVLEKFTFPKNQEFEAFVTDAESHEAAQEIYLKNRKPLDSGGGGENVGESKIKNN